MFQRPCFFKDTLINPVWLIPFWSWVIVAVVRRRHTGVPLKKASSRNMSFFVLMETETLLARSALTTIKYHILHTAHRAGQASAIRYVTRTCIGGCDNYRTAAPTLAPKRLQLCIIRQRKNIALIKNQPNGWGQTFPAHFIFTLLTIFAQHKIPLLERPPSFSKS